MIKVRRTTGSFLLVGLLLAFAIGCGGGDPAASPTTGAPTTPTASATPSAPGADPTSPPQDFTGTAVVGGRAEAQIFRVSLSGQGHADALLTRYGAFEPLLRAQDPARPEWSQVRSSGFSYTPEWNESLTEGIAHYWEIAPDQSKITFHIREGVPFHNDWGHVTAEDVAFSFNDAMSEGSVFTRADRLGQWINQFEAVDEFTVDMHIDLLHATWDRRLSNIGDTTVPIVSKQAFDALGSEAFNVTDTGTGPFTVRSWRTGDEIIMDRFDDYYREDGRAQVGAIRYVAMPEQSVQLAALETGQIDIATGLSTGLQFHLVPGAAQRSGGTVIEYGHPGQSELSFGGNYWAETDTEGNSLSRRAGFTPNSDHPWIGDPWGEGNSMESARLVRWAMAMAIDRELLNEMLYESLGTPRYTNINSVPGDEVWRDEWLIPYDPDRAKQYLADAGYPNGFSLRLFDGGTSPLSEPIGQMWNAIGLNVTIDGTGYEAIRPSRVDKSFKGVFFCGPPGEEKRTLDEAKGGLLIPRTGVMCAVELPDDIWPLYFANEGLLGPENRAERIQNNITMQDFISHWMLTAPVVYSPASLYLVKEGVEWYPHQADFAFFNSPETIRLDR